MAEKKPSSTFSRFIQRSRENKLYPDDQYKHASSLLDTDMAGDDMSVGMMKFSLLVNKDIQLANVGNDQLLRFYQTDFVLLTHLFDMARRDERLVSVFMVLYFATRNELLLSKTKGGTERKMQGAVGTSYAPKDALAGYGTELNYAQEKEEGGVFGPLAGLFGKKKRG